jgi:RHS repeat-associated protein
LPATASRPPGHLALASNGSVYLADRGNQRIRRISPAEIVSTVASGGSIIPAGDGVAAAQAALQAPFGVAVDGTGSNLYISDAVLHQVWKLVLPGGPAAGNLYVPSEDGADNDTSVSQVSAAGPTSTVETVTVADHPGQTSTPPAGVLLLQNLTDTDGLQTQVERTNDGTVSTTYPDGSSLVAQTVADPELGALAPYTATATLRLPSSLNQTATTSRTENVNPGSPFDAFGRITLDSNPGFQPFAFAGGLYDPQTNLLRFGARDYDPTTGRWTTQDPISFAGGSLGLYTYTNNDPINATDPEGTAEYRDKDFCDDVVTGTSVGMVMDMRNGRPQAYPGIGVPVLLAWHTLGRTACSLAYFNELTEDEIIGLGFSAALRRGAPGLRTGIASGAARVRLFRAIGPEELSSVMRDGNYGSAPSLSGKYFALTAQGAVDFSRAPLNAGTRLTLTSTTIPRSLLDKGFIFNDVGGAGSSIHFPQDLLLTFYGSMIPIQIH